MDKDTYEKTIRRQHRNGTSALACSICGEDDPTVIEFHHIFGRNNSNETIPLCKNCHAKNTEEQNKISPLSRSKKASHQEKRGYLLITVGSLLELIGKTLKDLGHEVICRE
jgi:5-methylcytosine-specific restriction endonuclease McrA